MHGNIRKKTAGSGSGGRKEPTLAQINYSHEVSNPSDDSSNIFGLSDIMFSDIVQLWHVY